MGIIVCATRGGEGSRAAQLRAVNIARESGKQLVFLYIVDTRTVGEIDEKLDAAVKAEFHWLGEALLRVALQRADRAGLKADFAMREGPFKEELERYLLESEADLLLLGAPRNTSAIFGDDAIEQFARAIQEDTGVRVDVVRPEQIEDGRNL